MYNVRTEIERGVQTMCNSCVYGVYDRVCTFKFTDIWSSTAREMMRQNHKVRLL